MTILMAKSEIRYSGKIVITIKRKLGRTGNEYNNETEICALLGYYAESCGNCLPTFRDNVSVPS